MSYNNLLLLRALLAGLGLMWTGRAAAQDFTNLHTFNGSNNEAFPWDSLIVSSNILYGTADGTSLMTAVGAVFALKTDGTGFTTLHTFARASGTAGPDGYGTNSDGAYPQDRLILSGNTLYGTAFACGPYGSGTLFALNTDGTGFTNLYRFTALPGTEGILGTGSNGDGASPFAGLILSGNTLYGTAALGGLYGNGTLFAINTDGTGFTNLHSFTVTSGSEGGYGTNSDGAYPAGGLVLSGNTLYGVAVAGGLSGTGTVFAVNTTGTGFTNLHSFSAVALNSQTYYTNSDGGFPYGALLLSGNTLYGTANQAGPSGSGTVFAVNTDGTGFTNLHGFSELFGSGGYGDKGTNSDGAEPYAGLILSGSTLYGTAYIGGLYGNGTLFALNTNGTGFTTLYSFPAVYGSSGINGNKTNSDGAKPYGGLALSGNTLFGTTEFGGTRGAGTMFSLTLPAPQLTVTTSDTNIILTWPTNYAGFDFTGYTLLTTTNLAPPAVWATNSPAAVVVNGQFTVTNPITGTQQFYQLSQ